MGKEKRDSLCDSSPSRSRVLIFIYFLLCKVFYIGAHFDAGVLRYATSLRLRSVRYVAIKYASNRTDLGMRLALLTGR
jgi:hypothetical protein